mmetsp:Transcript_30177/g.36636  ORF Transcript_30177/g.36636 Transcript_30177/m.36636 type:complete len:223 (-) Transcript_30177:237-905(-)
MHEMLVRLLYNHTSPPSELRGIFLPPPVPQVSLKVILPALIVKPVGHLVPDHNPHSTEIHRIIASGIEERILENGCREHDLIQHRMVICIHHLWSHEPPCPVYLRIYSLHRQRKFKRVASPHVPAVTGRVQIEGRVVDPTVGVPDFDPKCAHLLQSLSASGVAHPRHIPQPLPQHFLHCTHNLETFLFGLGREALCDIQLPDRFPEQSVHLIHDTFPSWLHF